MLRRAILGALLLATPAFARPLDELLPKKTILYVSLENVPRTKERFEGSALRALWDDESVQAFAANALDRAKAWLEKTRAEDGFTPIDVYEVVSGQLAVALSRIEPREGGDPKPRFVVLADVTGNEERVRELAGMVERSLDEAGDFRRDEEEFRGTSLVQYRTRRAGGEEDADDSTCWFLEDGLFGMAERVADLKEVLVLRSGVAEGALTENETYKRMRARLSARSDAVLFVNGLELFKAFQDAGTLDPRIVATIEALGLSSLEAFGMDAALGAADISMKGFLSMTGEKRGVMRLFAAGNTGAVPPGFVPPTSPSVGTFRLDAPDLMREMRRVAAAIDPGAAGMIDMVLGNVKAATGVDVEADVLGSLGKEVVFYTPRIVPAAPGGAGNPGPPALISIPRFVLAWKVTDGARLEGAFAKLFQQFGAMVEEQQFLGTKIRTLKAGLPVTPALAVLPDRLVVSMEADDLKELITRYGKDLKGMADEDDFRRATRGMPAERLGMSFAREARILRSSMIWPALGAAPGAQGMFDMDRFPSVETLERYLDGSATAIVDAEDGVAWHYRLKFKPQDRGE